MAIDVYTTVTDSIIKALEAGVAPWVKPWATNSGTGLPFNAVSKRPYSGTNVLLLFMAGGAKGYSSDGWLTYKQAQEAGGHVRKGEKGTQIVFAKQITKTTFDDAGNEQEERIPVLRLFTVFNVEQCEGLPDSLTGKVEQPAVAGIPLADAFIRGLKANVSYGGNKACYIPSRDLIRLPLLSAFKTPEDHYATAIHEHAHWTGHESRLNRNLRNRFGDEAYAAEELIAEMTAAFVCARLGLQGQLQHAEYIGSWLKVLKGDKRAIFTASAAAAKASDWLFEHAGDYAQHVYGGSPEPVPPSPSKGKGKARKPKAKPVRKPVYDRPYDYVSPELSADYRRSVRDRLRSDSAERAERSFESEVVEYSRLIMAQRGHVMRDRWGKYDLDKGTVVWRCQHGGKAIGPKVLTHVLPEHVFGWTPTVTCEETLADGSVKRSELVGEGRKARWVDTTRLRIVRPSKPEPAVYPVAAE